MLSDNQCASNFISEFGFDVVHWGGTYNLAADAVLQLQKGWTDPNELGDDLPKDIVSIVEQRGDTTGDDHDRALYYYYEFVSNAMTMSNW